MTKKVSIRRLNTGVPGLDAVMGGGIPEFSFNIIVGPPGSGQSRRDHLARADAAAAGRGDGEGRASELACVGSN